MNSTIDLSPNIQSYFDEVVHEALAARKVEATEAATRYLSGLLVDFAHADKATANLDQPLTFQLRDALESPGRVRFDRLRSIGDVVLYQLGFFGECITRRGADREYVMTVGSSAYGHASAMLRVGGAARGTHDVLDELARKFARFVEVMCEIADGAVAAASVNASGVLRLYERWQNTGSKRMADQLAQLGLCPATTPKGIH